MAYLLDTGILLRLTNAQDPFHGAVLQAVESLANQQEELYTTTQNVAEFWNVATRPVNENGLGLPPGTVVNLLEQTVEPVCAILLDRDTLYSELKRLAVRYGVTGKQVHDTRLVAMMLTRQIQHVLTLNERAFRRYEPEGITVVTPSSLATSG